MDFIKAIENALGKTAIKDFQPMQAGDVPATWANVDSLIEDTGFLPSTTVEQGIAKFVEWYKSYYNI